MLRDIGALREAATSAIERGNLDEALALYDELEQLEPTAPTWSKWIGEANRRAGNRISAIAAFERAIDKYVATGFIVQAIGTCKVILRIDPSNRATHERLAELLAPSTARARPAKGTPEPNVTRLSRRSRRVTLPPPSAAFDAVPLAEMVPSTEHRKHDDGSNSGVTVIHLDFDDLDVVEPSDDSLDVDIELPARKTVRRPIDDPRARRALSDTPLFLQVAPPILERLIARMSLVELAPQEILFREGEPGNALYVVSDGEVAVESGATELARLGPSQFFGEIAIVTDLPRSATIYALVRTELLAIDRDVVREAAEEYPELIPVMLRFVRERLVDRVTRTSELFRQFNESERADLVSGFELLEIAANVTLVNEGRRADGLYVVMAGSLEVRRASSAEPVATLGPGDVFGELSLLANHGAMASVTCLTRVIALRLPQSRFQALIMTHGRLLAYLGELAAKRSVTVDEDVVDFHLDLL